MEETKNEEFDFLEEENKITRKLFNLNEILEFQFKHDIQIVRGEDYNYMCYIDKEVYAVGLTPMFALAYGLKRYKEYHGIEKNI